MGLNPYNALSVVYTSSSRKVDKVNARILTKEGRYTIGSFRTTREAALSLEAAKMLLCANQLLIEELEPIIARDGFDLLGGTESTMKLVEENIKLSTDISDIESLLSVMQSLEPLGRED